MTFIVLIASAAWGILAGACLLMTWATRRAVASFARAADGAADRAAALSGPVHDAAWERFLDAHDLNSGP